MENAAMGEKKRKRTSIAAPEKRSLEAYFAVQVGSAMFVVVFVYLACVQLSLKMVEVGLVLRRFLY